MSTLTLCAEPSPIRNLEACPLEKGHEPPHVFWAQTKLGDTTYLTIRTGDGEELYRAQLNSPVGEPIEVTAILALMGVLEDR